MKRLMIVMAAILVSVTAVMAQSNTGDIPFNAEISQLDKYLKLNPTQRKKVRALNDSFVQSQKTGASQGQRMQQLLSENLSGMKDILSKSQFEKYVTLLTNTNKNKNIMNESSFTALVTQVKGK
ncbi:hypothetical protein LJC57_05585 [Parabacteroides sp. OttesenSCG-928-G07]|nr:hypothetical protein [Parabacteroides sp. OttesenSCG-928-G21]MDL2278045.1 hypothetical protein [Parabacteroides sp. OttesenSCG-928-G07]